MIEKISVDRTNEMGTVVLQCVNKINEIVEAFNELQAKDNEIKEWIGIVSYLREKVDNIERPTKPKEPVDPYAKQRKWIGSLVEYGNAEDGFRYGILTNINPTYKSLIDSIYKEYPFEIDNGKEMAADCWLPSETVLYKGE